MDTEPEQIPIRELLAQKDLDILNSRQHRWLSVLSGKPKYPRVEDSLREIFYAIGENKQLLALKLKSELTTIIEDRVVSILTDEKMFSLEEQKYVRANFEHFAEELNYLALFELEGKKDVLERHLASLKSEIPSTESAQREYKLIGKPKLEDVLNEARRLAQKLNSVDRNMVMSRQDYLDFKALYNGLTRAEQKVIKGETTRRKSKKSKNNTDQFANGYANLDLYIS